MLDNYLPIVVAARRHHTDHRVVLLNVHAIDRHICSSHIHWNILEDYWHIMGDNQLSIVAENDNHCHSANKLNDGNLEQNKYICFGVYIDTRNEKRARVRARKNLHTTFASVDNGQILLLLARLFLEIAHCCVSLIVRSANMSFRRVARRIFIALFGTRALRRALIVDHTFRPVRTLVR